MLIRDRDRNREKQRRKAPAIETTGRWGRGWMERTWGHWCWELCTGGRMDVGTLYDWNLIMSSFVRIWHSDSIEKKILSLSFCRFFFFTLKVDFREWNVILVFDLCVIKNYKRIYDLLFGGYSTGILGIIPVPVLKSDPWWYPGTICGTRNSNQGHSCCSWLQGKYPTFCPVLLTLIKK